MRVQSLLLASLTCVACSSPPPAPPAAPPVIVLHTASATPSADPPDAPSLHVPQAPALPAPTFGGDAPPPTDKVVEVSTGAYHACARRESGKVDCWGVLPGRDGAVLARPTRIPVGNAAQIASSGLITCILERAGAVRCFTPTIKPGEGPLAPTLIEGITSATRVAVGMGGGGTSQEDAHMVCALGKGGKVTCWTGTLYAPEPRPRAIAIAGLAPAKVLVVNYNFGSYACTLDAAGALSCWTMDPKLVDGADDKHPGRVHPMAASHPWRVQGLPPLDRVVVSWRGGCGLTPRGKAFCFSGPNDAPGGEDYPPRKPTIEATPDLDGALTLPAPYCGIFPNGRIPCSDEEGTIKIPGFVSFATMTTVYPPYSCAALATGGVSCWGSNDGGTLGGKSTIPHGSPAPEVVVGLDRAVEIAASDKSACALRDDGELRCWGAVGANEGAQSIPVTVARDVRLLVGTPRGVCAILKDRGRLACVEKPHSGGPLALVPVSGMEHVAELHYSNRLLQLRGEDKRRLSLNPWKMSEPTEVKALAASIDLVGDEWNGCALEARPGAVVCWQHNRKSKAAPAALATHAVGIPDAVELVSAGVYLCARRVSGAVACWGARAGASDSALLGPVAKTFAESDVPIEVPGLADARALVSSEHGVVCALRKGGGIRCWGRAESDTLGELFDPALAEPALADVQKLALGRSFACALAPNGLVACWGRNESGELGDGSLGYSKSPVAIQGL